MKTERQLVIAELNSPNSGGSSEMGFPPRSMVFRDLHDQNHRLLEDSKGYIHQDTRVVLN